MPEATLLTRQIVSPYMCSAPTRRRGALVAVLVPLLGLRCLSVALCTGPEFVPVPDAAPPPYELTAQLQTADAGTSAPVLALDYVSAADHVAVVFDPTVLRVERVHGERTVLATRGKWLPSANPGRYSVQVRRTTAEIVVALDGVTLVRVAQPAPEEAAVARCNPQEGTGLVETRVQPLAEINFSDDFMRTPAEPGEWERVFGTWGVASFERPKFSANPFCCRGERAYALSTAGSAFWADYLATAAVRLIPGTRAVGLAFAVQDRANFYRLDWMAGPKEFRLVRRRAGEEQVLARKPGVIGLDQWYQLEVLTVGTRIEVGVDRNALFVAEDPGLYGGKVGLWYQGSEAAYFDDVTVSSVAPEDLAKPLIEVVPRPVPVVNDIAVTDQFMKAWAALKQNATKGTLLDYTFKQAPVDWLEYTGQWGSMNRWECQPQWTWFGGKGPWGVTVWHKDAFVGDVTLEAFGSHMKDFPFNPVFRHPGNMCLTICGDGENLDSGYSFIFAGWGNHWTRLLRRGTVVAETNKALMPDNRDGLSVEGQYRNWYGVRLRKEGAKLICFVDDKEVLRWEDPEPLPGRRVAVWTVDNTILLARARILADEVLPGGLPSPAMVWRPGLESPPGTPGSREAVAGVERPLTNPLHRATEPSARRGESEAAGPTAARLPLRFSFDRSLDGWANRDGENGALLTLDRTAGARGASCLKLVNAKSGGTFAAAVPLTNCDASRSAIRFDYRVGPGVKTNLYLKVDGWWYTVVFTAPDAKCWRAPRLGEFENVQAEGAWHATSFRLADALTSRKLVTPEGGLGREAFLIEDAFLGFWSDDVYAVCGFEHNPAGATYFLDNFEVRSAPPAKQGPVPPTTAQPEGLRCDDWRNYGGPRGMTVWSTPWDTTDGSRSLLLVNERLGGIAGAAIRSVPFDASQYPVVSFDYRCDDSARIDVWVELAFGATMADRWRTVKFTDSDEAWPVIGKCPGVVTDGEWRHCEFNLGEMLGRKRNVDSTVSRLVMASGGWPGNEEGCHLWFKDFRLLPAPKVEGTPADPEPPTVTEVSPAEGAASGECRITARLVDAGSGVLPASIRLRVGKRWYSLSDTELAFDRASGLLTWDGLKSRPHPTTFGNGEVVPCRIQVEDSADNALAKPCTWAWRMSFAADKLAPPAPWVNHVPVKPLVREEFEAADAPKFGQWGHADLRVTQEASATGRGSLLITDYGPDGFAGGMERDPVDVEQYPYLAFDYLTDPIPNPVSAYSVYTLQFNGQGGDRFEVGPIPAAAPGKWAHAEFDLRSCMKPSLGPPYFFMVGESGAQNSRPGSRLYVDNFTLYSRAARTVKVQWSTPTDASGVTGYSWCLDADPATVPEETVKRTATEAQWDVPEAGTYYAHVRARDGAGNWGATGHCRVVVE
ncbi:MAG: hypothetical protein GW911_01850 [Armatimonadetes bacterium]|nr:hypothetical protein [Armatimonadota bacterium]